MSSMIAHQLLADDITIHNSTPYDLYVAAYYKQDRPSFSVTRIGDIELINSASKITLSRLYRRIGSDRRVLFAQDPTLLKETLSGNEYQQVGRIAIGLTQGTSFVIIEKDGALLVLNYKDLLTASLKKKLNPLSSAYKKATDIIDMIVESSRKKVIKHAYTDQVAHTRIGNELSLQEKQFRAMRSEKIRKAVAALTGMPELSDDETPTIALCGSGGGYRAMIEMVGSLKGAYDGGILDTCMYMSGLSGSTWAIMPWLASGLSIEEYRTQLQEKVKKGITLPSLDEMLNIAKRLVEKKVYGQSVHALDLYGALLADILLKGFAQNVQEITLSSIQHNLSKNIYPLPIATALDVSGTYSKWFEFTPFEIGSYNMDAYVPSWSFGRVFQNGISTNSARSQNLGFYLGMWGSAFAINFSGIVYEVTKVLTALLPSLSFLKTAADEFGITALKHEIQTAIHSIKELRLFPALIPNITYKMLGESMSGTEMLKLIDGGHDIMEKDRLNIGIMPLLRSERGVNIIIVCDAAAHGRGATTLRATIARAQRDGFKLPPIDFEKASNHKVSMFYDEHDPNVPIIIYVPGTKNPDYGTFNPVTAKFTKTTNFTYKPDEFDLLSGLTSFDIIQAKSVIIAAIKKVIATKKMQKQVVQSFAEALA